MQHIALVAVAGCCKELVSVGTNLSSAGCRCEFSHLEVLIYIAVRVIMTSQNADVPSCYSHGTSYTPPGHVLSVFSFPLE